MLVKDFEIFFMKSNEAIDEFLIGSRESHMSFKYLGRMRHILR